MVVGLGNPGRAYEKSRHNVGFEVLDALARRHGGRFRRTWRANAKVSRMRLDGEDVLLVKPQTFMNRSGEAVGPLMRKHGLSPEDVIVVVDDADLPPGRLRIRKRGGAGNHNGLKSMIGGLGTEAFIRLRVGVGGRPQNGDMVEHVLSPVGAQERQVLERAVTVAIEAVECLLREGPDEAMNKFNQAS